MLNFSSVKFSKLYLDSYIPSSVKIRHLRMTEAYFELLDKINQVVDFINRNGGWTVVGWYKRGVINDRALVGSSGNTAGNFSNNSNNEDVRVDNGEINYHVVEVLPSNRSIITPVTVLNNTLNEMKFSVQTICERE